jgi:hypothetical protein
MEFDGKQKTHQEFIDECIRFIKDKEDYIIHGTPMIEISPHCFRLEENTLTATKRVVISFNYYEMTP